MYLCRSEIGTKDTLFRVFSCGRQTADLSLTSNPSSARLPSACLFAAWTWQVGDLNFKASTKSCAFFSRFTILLPSAYLPCDPSLPISVFPLLSLCFSLSLKSSTPESPKTPESPWDLEWMPAQLTRAFCTLSYKDMDANPPTPTPQTEEPFSGGHCSERILTVNSSWILSLMHIDVKCKTDATVFCWAIFQCSHNKD